MTIGEPRVISYLRLNPRFQTLQVLSRHVGFGPETWKKTMIRLLSKNSYARKFEKNSRAGWQIWFFYFTVYAVCLALLISSEGPPRDPSIASP